MLFCRRALPVSCRHHARGSGEGMFTRAAELLASRDIAAMSLAILRSRWGCPHESKRIPLGNRDRHSLWPPSGSPSGRIGHCRSLSEAELALWSRRLIRSIRAVVGWAPSGLTYGGLSRTPEDRVAAWSYRGRDFPSAGFDASAIDWHRQTDSHSRLGSSPPLGSTPPPWQQRKFQSSVSTAWRLALLVSTCDDQRLAVEYSQSYGRGAARGSMDTRSCLNISATKAPDTPSHRRTHAFHFARHTSYPVTGYDFELGRDARIGR